MRIIALVPVLMLAACDQIGLGGGEPAKPAAPAEVEDASLTIVPTEANAEQLIVPEALNVVYNSDSTVSISGVVDNPLPGGQTNGVAFVVSPEDEEDASGNTVTVSVKASGSPGAQMLVAYSTAQVGNSGWQTFDLTGSMQDYSFEYDVPALTEANNDYIGIIPVGGDIRVASVSVDIP